MSEDPDAHLLKEVHHNIVASGSIFEATANKAFEIAGVDAASVAKLQQVGVTDWQILEEISLATADEKASVIGSFLQGVGLHDGIHAIVSAISKVSGAGARADRQCVAVMMGFPACFSFSSFVLPLRGWVRCGRLPRGWVPPSSARLGAAVSFSPPHTSLSRGFAPPLAFARGFPGVVLVLLRRLGPSCPPCPPPNPPGLPVWGALLMRGGECDSHMFRPFSY